MDTITDNTRVYVAVEMTPPDFGDEAADALAEVLSDVATERARQIALGHDRGHDDRHTATELECQITTILMKALVEPTHDGRRRRLVQAAAVAVAAVERLDRLSTTGTREAAIAAQPAAETGDQTWGDQLHALLVELNPEEPAAYAATMRAIAALAAEAAETVEAAHG